MKTFISNQIENQYSYSAQPWEYLYDTLYADYDSDKEYYLSQGKNTNGHILELGCGTGRITLELARMGLHVTGVDTSISLLNCLRSHMTREKLSIPLLEQDITQLSIDDSFSLAIMPFRAFLHINDRNKQIQALKSIRSHLKNNGKLCFDISVPNYEFLLLSHNKTFLKKEISINKGKILWYRLYETYLNSQKLKFTDIIKLYDTNGVLCKEYNLPHTIRLVNSEELKSMVKAAGYRSVQLFGGFDRRPLNPNASEIVCEAIV